IPMRKRIGGHEGIGLFVLNGTGRSVSADLIFPHEVEISDLAMAIVSGEEMPGEVSQPGERFSLEVPPCGIIPVGVDGFGKQDIEKKVAQKEAEHTQRSAWEA